MKALKKYLDKRKSEIQLLLEIPPQKFTSTAFHKLRLEIKKLNSLLMLINKCSKDFKYKKTFKPFEKIFNQAGNVRELEIESSMMRKYFPVPALKAYKDNLKKSKLDERSSFFTTIHLITQSDLEKKYSRIKHFLSRVNKKETLKYLNKNQRNIENLLHTSVLETEQVHELRKGLKDYNYCRKSLNVEDKFRTFPYQEKLIILLGKWHDGRVIIRHLSKDADDIKLMPRELKKLQKIKENIYSQNEILFDKINKLRCMN
ncbi:MAG TPA: CHAD domain-containing protein [Saprospiraceae bacterium]|nr:CHAD domain-containing protein [Saprospiraceae bacterium]